MLPFRTHIVQIASSLDFAVSSRGWCYLLEDQAGLPKGAFDQAQDLINDCRKRGRLPLDIVSVDGAREFDHVQHVDDTTPDEEAALIIDAIAEAPSNYVPFGFWDDQPFYAQMLVEKGDLKKLFSPVCARYNVPLATSRGWNDINGRVSMMRRFREMETRGKQCVLLYCGDFDPGGLNISDHLRSNMEDMAEAIGWRPENLIIDRFGLNLDFIETQALTWIDNLETSSGRRLDDPRHQDHGKPYVQDYIQRYGVRKVEANATAKD